MLVTLGAVVGLPVGLTFTAARPVGIPVVVDSTLSAANAVGAFVADLRLPLQPPRSQRYPLHPALMLDQQLLE